MANFISGGFLLLFLLFSGVPVRAQAAASSGFPNNEQLRRFKTMSDPRLASDGKRILIRVTDTTADGAKSHLWLTGVDGEDPRQLTYSPDVDKRGEYEGEWMPDGESILFLAKRGDHTSLYRLPMNGGEARAFELKVKPLVDQAKLPDALPPKDQAKPEDVTNAKAGTSSDEVPIDIARYRIAPDGSSIAIIADDPQTPGEKAQKEAKADAEWVNHNPHGSRLYLLNVETGKLIRLAMEPDVRDAYWTNDSSAGRRSSPRP